MPRRRARTFVKENFRGWISKLARSGLGGAGLRSAGEGAALANEIARRRDHMPKDERQAVFPLTEANLRINAGEATVGRGLARRAIELQHDSCDARAPEGIA